MGTPSLVKDNLIVLGRRYRLDVVDGLMDEHGDFVWGDADCRLNVVRLHARALSDLVLLWDTLIHEELHIIFEQNQALQALVPDAELAHKLIYSLASILADTLVRNDLVKPLVDSK